MKLCEVKKEPDGTFVGVRISKDSTDKLYEMVKELDVPNPLDKKQYHITVMYSRKHLPHLDVLGKFDKPIIAKIRKFSIFDMQNGNKCLVIELNCPELTKRHNHIMKVHDATYDWDEYKCHLTLSYDIEDFSIRGKSPKKFIKEIEVISEYQEKLDELNDD